MILYSLHFNACRQSGETRSSVPPARVRMEQVRATSVPRSIELSGSLEASKTVKLGFMVAGKIDSLPIRENSWVDAGKLIARVEPANYEIALEIASATLDQAQDEYDRLEQLKKAGSVSASDFSKVHNGLRQAKAQRRLQQKNLADTRLCSPISGVLIKSGAEAGEIAPIGVPLFVVAAIQPIRVVSRIPEQEMRFIRPGQEAEVKVGALGLEAKGLITQIGKAADPVTRSFAVEVELPNVDKRLLPGMVAEILIPQNDSTSRITVPLTSLRRFGAETAVFAFDNGTSRAYQRKISIGRIHGDRAEVLSGLQTGDFVITDGSSELQNGAAVQVSGAAR
ncbi:MAG TPA: efflux RND transporter periplasmic adaptor subunit [Fibrobacteria bacterium]|nr:efflux RND transporter periplasmic adaptor subunit [Fibrobacteria bacterium]